MDMTKEECLESISDAIHAVTNAQFRIMDMAHVRRAMETMKADCPQIQTVQKLLTEARVMDASSMVLLKLHEALNELQKLNVKE